jgi:hypothetical protein
MRNGDYAAGGVNQLGDGLELRERLLHEGRPTTSEKPIESIAQIDGPPLPNDGSGDVRPTHRATSRFLEHVFERELNTQPLKLLDHFLGSADAIGPAALEEGLQRLGLRGEEVSQHMHLAPWSRRRELASANHPNPVMVTGNQGRRNPGHGIVIGKCNGPETHSRRPPDDDLRRGASVRSGRVNMQVDRFPGSR